MCVHVCCTYDLCEHMHTCVQVEARGTHRCFPNLSLLGFSIVCAWGGEGSVHVKVRGQHVGALFSRVWGQAS